MGATAAVCLVLLVLQPFPILHDYPEWMYQGHIVWSLWSDLPVFADHYELVPVPVPNAISQAGIALLNMFVSPVAAGRIWLGLYFLLATVVLLLAGRRHTYPGSMQIILLFTIVLGPGFFNGYINFQFGVLLLALFVVTESVRSVWRILVFSLLIYFSHATVFLAFTLYVVGSGFLSSRRFAVLPALMPAQLLLVWYAIVRINDEGIFNTGLGSGKEWLQYKLYTVAKQGPFHNFIQADGQSLLADLHGVYLTGFLINFITALLIGSWFLFIGWQLLQKSKTGTLQHGIPATVLITVSVLLALWLIAGRNTFGVVNLGERLLIVAVMLLLLTAPMPRWLAASWATLCLLTGATTVLALVVLSNTQQGYAVARSADSTRLQSFVNDIYANSRHKYFNHRLTIYYNLGQYLLEPESYKKPPPIDHESSIVRRLSAE